MSSNQIALKNVVSMETLTNAEVLSLIKRGIEFKNGAKAHYDEQHIIANLFFEPSTRTHKAFEVAELKLGCDLLDFDSKTSSINKGETLYDTILTMSALGVDVCVIRHPEVDYYKNISRKSNYYNFNCKWRGRFWTTSKSKFVGFDDHLSRIWTF